MRNESRRIELSNKMLQMGQALMQEGSNQKDYTVTQTGTILILVSTLLLNDDDMFIFSELCAMFSAKKILDEAENITPLESEMFARILQKKNDANKPAIPEQPKKKRRKKSDDNPDAEK